MLTSSTVGDFNSVKRSKILLCVSLEGEPGLCPKAALLFLAVPPLSLYPLSSLIRGCSNLPFGIQGRSWRLESIPYIQEMGNTESLPCPGAPQGPAWFQAEIRKFFSVKPNNSRKKDLKVGTLEILQLIGSAG